MIHCVFRTNTRCINAEYTSRSMSYIVIHRGVRKYFMHGYEEIGVFIWICLIIFVSL